MLLDTIATIILVGMMLIPLVNIVVGIVVGAGLAGLPGALLGLTAAVAVTGVVKLAADQRRFRVASTDAPVLTPAPPLEAQPDLRRLIRKRSFSPRRRVPLSNVHVPENFARTLH